MKTFFTSDTHFYHSNIIKYCLRPFADAHEMNETLIANWNNVVSIVKIEWVGGNTIVLANYHGCLSFEGNKLMLLRGNLPNEYIENLSTVDNKDIPLDPHFLNEDYPVIARFIPNEEGWKMARLCAGTI